MAEWPRCTLCFATALCCLATERGLGNAVGCVLTGAYKRPVFTLNPPPGRACRLSRIKPRQSAPEACSPHEWALPLSGQADQDDRYCACSRNRDTQRNTQGVGLIRSTLSAMRTLPDRRLGGEDRIHWHHPGCCARHTSGAPCGDSGPFSSGMVGSQGIERVSCVATPW